MSSYQAFYRNPLALATAEGFTHVFIVGVERVGADASEAVHEDALKQSFTPEPVPLSQFVSEGVARQSVAALLDFWLEALADELEGAQRTPLKIGSIWVALSDVARQPPHGADASGPFVGVELNAETIARIEATDVHLPALARSGPRVFADIRTRATYGDLREMFEAAVGDDRAENTIALHWVGHGLSDGKGAFARDLLVYGDAEFGSPRLVLRESLLIGLEKKFAAEQIYAFVDACRASGEDAPEGLDETAPPFKGFEEKKKYHPKTWSYGRTAVLMSADKGQRSFGMPNEPTCFTYALIDAFKHFGAADPFNGSREVGDPGALEIAISRHIFLQLMGMPVHRKLPDRVRHALEDVRGHKLPATALAQHDGESSRPLLHVLESRSLLLVVHDKDACAYAGLSPVEAELWDDLAPARQSQTRPVSYPPSAASSGRWSSYCRFGATVRARLVHPEKRGQDHRFSVPTGYQRLGVTF